MNGRLKWVKDLVDHLKSDPNLNEIAAKYIQVKAEYRGLDEDIQHSPQIWLVPLEAKPEKKINGRYSTCPQRISHKFLLAVVVRNVYDTRNNVDWSHSGSQVFLGAYPEADALELKVRKSVLEFNRLLENSPQDYDSFSLVEMPQPDSALNGNLVLGCFYETSYTF